MSALNRVGKNALIAAAVLAMAGSALAAGPKDGIYVFANPAPTADAQEFLTLHTNDAGAVVAGLYRSKAATTANRAMGLSIYSMEGGQLDANGVPQSPGTVQAHMFRWSSWDSLSGTMSNNVATLTGTANHVGCTSKVTVYLDGAQPTLTMQSSVSDFAKDQIWAGLRPMFSGQFAIILATNAFNAAVAKLTSECAKPSFNFTANLQKWF